MSQERVEDLTHEKKMNPTYKGEGLRRQFLIWLGIPAFARAEDEKDQKSWGVKYGVSKMCMLRWKQDPEGKVITDDAYRALAGNEVLPILQEMIRKAKDGNVQAARLVLDYAEKNPKNSPKNIEVTLITRE